MEVLSYHTRFTYFSDNVVITTPSGKLTISLNNIWKTLVLIPLSGEMSEANQMFTPYMEAMPLEAFEEVVTENDFALLRHGFWCEVFGYRIYGTILMMGYHQASGAPPEPYKIVEITDVMPCN